MLFNNGGTRRIEIADILGYANHNAVSKRLVQVRRTAEAYFHGN